MSLPPLTIISAGAGSGKTYTIQKQLSEWVLSRKVDIERVLAVTFTESAATELRDRIAAELVANNLLEEALKLDRACLSTIHSFGLRVLTEFAFEAGMSPLPRLLNETEQKALIRKSLAKTDKADTLLSDLSAFGYLYDHVTGSSAEEQFRETILTLISILRLLGIAGPEPGLSLARPSIDRIAALYGPTGDPDALEQNLCDAAKALLARFPQNLAVRYPGNEAATEALRKDFTNLKKAAGKEELRENWNIWKSLRRMRLSKRGSALPPGYDDAAQAVMAAAEGVVRHPAPLRGAIAHINGLLGAALEAMELYRELKASKGLVDYTDMLTVAHGLVAGRPDVMEALKARFDCIIFDEFQDTNPLQFSLFWMFHEAGIPAFIVGDLKQAIMGFQNADSRLLAEMQRKYPKQTRRLQSNFRSAPGLMAFLNDAGAGLFGEGYTPLTPKACIPEPIEPLEIIEFSDKLNKEKRARHMAGRVAGLLDEKISIYDRKLKTRREIRGSDIAVLCPRHSHLNLYPEILGEYGIRAQREVEGWFESRVVQIVYYAMSYVANPADEHAALYLAVSELGSHDLASALSEYLDSGGIADPVLEILRTVTQNGDDRQADTILNNAIDALDLYGAISGWDDAAQARANLLKLQAVAKEFITANREALASGGFYGTGVFTFLSWLKDVAQNENNQPPPRALDEDAVWLVTWHGAKGREWPVVFVCATEAEAKPHLPNFNIAYGDFSDLGGILNSAQIEIWPKLSIKEKNKLCEAELEAGAVSDACNLLYVALTRARERLILQYPRYLNSDNMAYWSILEDKTGISVPDGALRVNGGTHPCRHTVILKGDLPREPGSRKMISAPVFGLRAVERRPLPGGLTPESIIPSLLHGSYVPDRIELKEYSYAEPEHIDLGVAGMKGGSILHKCFELVSGNLARIGRLSELAGHEFDAAQAAAIAGLIENYDAFIAKTFTPRKIFNEIPILGVDENGSVVSGAVDTLLDAGDNLIIIDHKSDRTNDYSERFFHYLPQLMAYAKILDGVYPDRRVSMIAINWIAQGSIMAAKLSS